MAELKELTCKGPYNKGCGEAYPNCVYAVVYHDVGGKRTIRKSHKVAHNHPGKPCKPEA